MAGGLFHLRNSAKLILKNENRQIDFDAFDLQKIKKSVAVYLYIDHFYSLISADNILIFFVIRYYTYGNLLKYIAVAAKFFNKNCEYCHFKVGLLFTLIFSAPSFQG